MCSNNCVDVVELDYVVLKLNGSDITSLSNYEAVQMFLQAKENLVVELCRKQNKERNSISADDVDAAKDDQHAQMSTTKVTSNTNAILSLPAAARNQIILSLRSFNAGPSSATKETQTIEDFVDLKKNRARSDHNNKLAQTIADHFIEREHHLFEQCLEPEIDIEEVTLVKSESASDPIGLSVCCNNGFLAIKNSVECIKPVIYKEKTTDGAAEVDAEADVDVCEDVFISDIKPESIAYRDGRLRRGDQILRINGIDTKSRKQAETQIAENNIAITLLVSRLLYPVNDEEEDMDSNFEYANSFLTDDYTNVVDKLDKVLLTQRQSIKPVIELITGTSSTSKTNKKANAEISMKKVPTSDKTKARNANQTMLVKSQPPPPAALVQRAPKAKLYDYDESEHIYETIPEDETETETEPLYCSPYQSSNYMTALGSCSAETDILEMQQQTQRVAQWLGIKSQPRNVHTLASRSSFSTNNNKQQKNRISSSHRVYTLRSGITTNTSGSSSSGAATNIEPEMIISNHQQQQQQLQQHQLLHHNQLLHQHEELENSSSAYNTGGSNNSASPRQQQQQQNGANNIELDSVPIVAGQQQPATDNNLITSPIGNILMLPFGNKTTPRLQQNTPSDAAILSKVCGDDSLPFPLKQDSKLMRAKATDEQLAQCPQFNAPNLSRYHFVSSQEVANKTATVPLKSSSILVTTENVTEEIPMVWKVKRRPDGTRYIVKRPVRNNVSVGIRKSIRNSELTTTEDDTISEVKIGRYWTKEERKRHIERARERRHHQQQQLLQQQQQQQHQQQ
ncbi:GH23937 [Drosophila grimshawi]|uniref:GH23937 n=1 Tax=Drosophila grimshawi TaxID=7222 RepID=B4JZT9_DROGR|nr:GH23937 [Drosophila grimshawi]